MENNKRKIEYDNNKKLYSKSLKQVDGNVFKKILYRIT